MARAVSTPPDVAHPARRPARFVTRGHDAAATHLAALLADLVAAWACSACHDAIDRRSHTDLDRDYVRLAHLEGMARTINELAKEGLL